MSGSDLLPQEDERRSLLRSDPLSSSLSPSPSTSQPQVANSTNLGTPRGLLSRLHVDRQTSPEPVAEANAGTPRTALRLSSGGLTRRSLHVESSRLEPNVTAGSPRSVVRDELADGAPPEWALLLIGCLLGLATGVCVAAFNRGVHVIHEWAWAGTPNEGAAWLRLQRLADTWHRILLVPVTGGVIVGMMHGLLEIFEQIRQMRNSQRKTLDILTAVFPTIKAVQAAVTLGTGCSLGPEGPSVDIGKSCANGCSEMMENNRERRIALLAAGAAAGIASGFNAAVAGCFFAIETVLRPLQAENSPPFTTAMIILASVISSTVSNVLLGEKPAFIVPTYELKSAAELPLYLILGMLCGAVSVVFTRLVIWFTKFFDHIKKKFNLPAVVCPALGGLGAGLIALKYPGVLYWGFTNVEEILHTGKGASAPGIWLVAQLAAAKVVATALCKGSGLVGGLYAPSLMIGAAIGAVFGGSAAHIINTAIPGNSAVAQPQAYALVGMAATLASVCSVPLTSVLLLFELTKDYRILLPLMGAVGLAIWVPSVTNRHKGGKLFEAGSSRHGYSLISLEDKDGALVKVNGGDDLELAIAQSDILHYEANDEELLLDDLKVSQAMSKIYVKVKPNISVKEAVKLMQDKHQSCVLVVDGEEYLEGIVTFGDIRRHGFFAPSEASVNGGELPPTPDGNSLISSCLTRGFQYRGSERGLLTCFQDTDLTTAKELMEAKGIKQLPVVKRGKSRGMDGKRRLIGLLYYDYIGQCLQEELERWKAIYQREQELLQIATNTD
ncbi:chloride channel protein CLC-f-like protein [Carex littledalei]|uniref:Chloride channel protein n=1 Tax=Carex littledalei TaxID=544730 RepID=A0A833VNV4_9POAL|nr:chloride channel protein CLC-f-like protein [Carex littledalei]